VDWDAQYTSRGAPTGEREPFAQNHLSKPSDQVILKVV
jgi:hypothetical protein